MEKIHIAVAFCDPNGTYCQHAAVTIASVFANTKSTVCVHVVHDETLTDENRAKLEELAENFKQEIDFINVDPYLDEDKIDVSKLSADGHKGTVFRLLLPEICAENKMIYLDCDIVVTLDIAELWDIDLQGKAVAVVPDVWSLEYNEGTKAWPKGYGKIWDMLGIKRGEYFNAGVLLLNLKKLREEYDFLKAVESFYAKFKNCIFFADQDCLNHIFAKDKILIDEKFDRIRFKNTTESQINNSIWHFAGYKPWADYERPNIDELYWKYYKTTPYCGNEKAFITAMARAFTSSQHYHRHSSDCVKKLRIQIWDNILHGHIWIPIRVFWAKCKMRG